MITYPLIWQVVHSDHLTFYSILETIIACYFRRYFNFLFLIRSILRVLWIIEQEIIYLFLRHICVAMQQSVWWQLNKLVANHNLFIYTIGTPLAICHCLLPCHTHYRIKTIGWMTEIIFLVWLIIRHLITPYSSIW